MREWYGLYCPQLKEEVNLLFENLLMGEVPEKREVRE